MHPSPSKARRSPRSVGGPITPEYFNFLTHGFCSEHPTEQTALFIPKEAVLETLRQIPGISGVRFMYGIEPAADPASRTLILVPCTDAPTDRAVPNLLFLKAGYLDHRGQRIAAGECWQLFSRYVDRMQTLLPGAKRNEIPRAYFMGRHMLEQMLNDDRAVGLVFHFGCNRTEPILGLRYTAALTSVDEERIAFGLPVDTGIPCPPATNCPGTPPFDMPLFRKLLTELDSATLTEFYLYAEPALTDAFLESGRAREYQDTVRQTLTTCTQLIQTGHHDQARVAFKNGLATLIDEHLRDN